MIFKKAKFTILIFIFIFCITNKVISQIGKRTFTLETFIEEVKINNYNLKISKNKTVISSLAINEAMSSLLPHINGQTGFKRYFNDQYTYFEGPDYENIDPITGEIPQVMQKFKMGFDNDFQAHILLQQSLFSLKNIYELQSAKQYSVVAKLQEQEYTIKLISESKKMFLQTALMKKAYEVSISSEQLAKENYMSIKNKFENKLISELELLQAKILLEEEMPKLLKARRNYLILLENLKVIAGINSNDSISIKYDFSEEYNNISKSNPNEAINERIEFQLLDNYKKLQTKNLQLQKAAYFPSIELQAGHSYFSSSDKWSINENKNKFTYANLTLTIPIFSSGYRRTQIKKAKIALENADFEKISAVQSMTIEIKNLELKLSEESKAIVAAKTMFKTSQKAYQIMFDNANNGLTSQLDLRKMTNDLKLAEINYYNNIYTYECTLIDFNNAIANY